jgi:hypothetical protein
VILRGKGWLLAFVAAFLQLKTLFSTLTSPLSTPQIISTVWKKKFFTVPVPWLLGCLGCLGCLEFEPVLGATTNGEKTHFTSKQARKQSFRPYRISKFPH